MKRVGLDFAGSREIYLYFFLVLSMREVVLFVSCGVFGELFYRVKF